MEDPASGPPSRVGPPYGHWLPRESVDAPPPLAPRPRPQRRKLALVLYLATWGTTLLVGGPLYAACLMTILTAHELGHYLQARRWKVPASLPFFIPVPLPPFGTFGAVIVMRRRMRNLRALFDVGITGPLAGLVPTLVCVVVGLHFSTVGPPPDPETTMLLGEPLVFQWLSHLVLGPVPEGQDVMLHPVAYAGWVGIFITALNLIPIGQLDGGHILYALLRRRAHLVATAFLGAAIGAVILTGNWGWSLMLALLLFMGPRHPPTLDDHVPLGPIRVVLGWLTLLFFVVGFTPVPIVAVPGG